MSLLELGLSGRGVYKRKSPHARSDSVAPLHGRHATSASGARSIGGLRFKVRHAKYA